MKTFDYESAWREVAKPAYQSLDAKIIALMEQVARDAAELSQSGDLSMPWPATDLKAKFQALPDDQLAFATRVIYDCGHWFPTGGELNLPGRESGCHWKFSHYADQVLRERLNIAGETPFQIHEGAIRICYSSRDTWTWTEITPATQSGLTIAKTLCSQRDQLLAGLSGNKRDAMAHQWYEKLRVEWPADWQPFMNLEHYHREEQAIKADKKPTSKDRERVIKDCAREIEVATQERDGLVWLIDHGLHIDNVIHYSHENGGAGLFCFGWREPVINAIRDTILSIISEFPFAYRIKCADGKVLEGGIN